MILTFTYSDLENLIKRAVAENTDDLQYLLRTEDEIELKVVDCKAVNASVKVSECGLSNRAINCIQHYIGREAENKHIASLISKTAGEIDYFINTMTAIEALHCIPSLQDIHGCGVETAKEIIHKFEALGLNVDNWKAELKNWHKVGAGV